MGEMLNLKSFYASLVLRWSFRVVEVLHVAVRQALTEPKLYEKQNTVFYVRLMHVQSSSAAMREIQKRLIFAPSKVNLKL